MDGFEIIRLPDDKYTRINLRYVYEVKHNGDHIITIFSYPNYYSPVWQGEIILQEFLNRENDLFYNLINQYHYSLPNMYEFTIHYLFGNEHKLIDINRDNIEELIKITRDFSHEIYFARIDNCFFVLWADLNPPKRTIKEIGIALNIDLTPSMIELYEYTNMLNKRFSENERESLIQDWSRKRIGENR